MSLGRPSRSTRGLDLVFPHHENELAQSRAAGQEFAHIWMHNGLLRLNRRKDSKSLGNIQTLERVLDDGRETLLLFFMTAHWRSPIDFSPETMMQARTQVDAFRELFRMKFRSITQQFHRAGIPSRGAEIRRSAR